MLEVEKELQIGVFLEEVEQVVLNKQLTDFAKMIYLHLKLQEKRMAVQELKLKRELVHRFGIDELKFYDGLNELIYGGWVGFLKMTGNDDEVVYVYYVKEESPKKPVQSAIPQPVVTESEEKPRRKLTREMLKKTELRTEEKPKPSKYEVYKRMDLLTEEDRMAFENLTKFD